MCEGPWRAHSRKGEFPKASNLCTAPTDQDYTAPEKGNDVHCATNGEHCLRTVVNGELPQAEVEARGFVWRSGHS